MGHLRALFAGLSANPAEVEARCLLTFSLLIGNHYITADHASYSRPPMCWKWPFVNSPLGAVLTHDWGRDSGHQGEPTGRQVQGTRGALTGRCAWVVALPPAPLAGSRSRIPALDSHGLAAHSRAGGGTFLQYTRRCASDDGSHVRHGSMTCCAPRCPFIVGAPKVIVAGYGNPSYGTQHLAGSRRGASAGPGCRADRRGGCLGAGTTRSKLEESHERTYEHDGPRDG